MSERIGPYQVLGVLGQGAHSKIIHIRRASDSRQYALKLVPIGSKEDEKFLEQAELEYRVGQKLDHANLIRVFLLEKVRTLGFFGGIKEARLLVEYVNGETLDRFRPLGLPRLVQVFEGVAAGMVHMHRRGVYHGDLKPNNILLSRTGEVKVFDYGLAWVRGEAKGRIQGTPEYIAPEQLARKCVTEHTDLFNFGATMYKLVTGKNTPSMMSGGGSLSQSAKAWQQILKPVRDLAPETPEPLAKLIEQCLAHNPQARPASMSEVQGTLSHLVDDLVTKADDQLENWDWGADDLVAKK